RSMMPAAVRRRKPGFIQRVFVSLARFPAPQDLEQLRRRAPRQARILEILSEQGSSRLSVLLKKSGAGRQSVRRLESKGWVRTARRTAERDPWERELILPSTPPELMPQQKRALAAIGDAIQGGEPRVVLLFGVTGSGKTEVYLGAIAEVLQRGQGAIVLVPEISLTPQTVERFRSRFGDTVAVLHSGLSEGERHDEWHRLNRGEARIAIGARSALFAPVRNPGLIVVDEEHETTYKQEETPRYHARDVAVMRGRQEGCAVVLGSATPSLETYYNAVRGKYRLVELPVRVDHRRMPTVRVVDMRVEAEKAGLRVISADLLEAVRLRLERGEQVMFFLNRRGFASALICPRCGYAAACADCSVTMTYHLQGPRLLCHLCGREQKVPARCPQCGDKTFRYAGVGTQRVEQVAARLFPGAVVQRMDSDITTRRGAHRRILWDFRAGKIDILIGTQMIAKGLDFPNVTLVGVIYADIMLHMPDFRAAERTFQLLTQVAGRAGRGELSGEVVVQTFTPYHPAIQAARSLDFRTFYDQEVEFRRELAYPPFARLACVRFRGESEAAVKETAERLKHAVEPELSGTAISGPAPAPVAKVRGKFRYQLLLRSRGIRTVCRALKDILRRFRAPRGVEITVDVDPVSLL
ncbi:MAG TPA: primosomal protein N', partial [Kiritimatiellae bacterium]|nr:primosomal protein N' [Kiritimatiellia bacterium]